MQIASEHGLDLVKVAGNPACAVCKLLNYDKYRFAQQKKEKEIKKNQKIVELKEVAFSVDVQDNDLDLKIRNARKFLQKGNKVKLVCKMFVRQREYANRAIEKVNQVANALTDCGVIEKPAIVAMARNAIVIMGPIKK